MTVIGYARVSTGEQDLTIQTEALKEAGCIKIRKETVSGTSRKGRSELETLMEFMDKRGVLIVALIDRLARSMKDLQDIVHELKQRKGVYKGRNPSIDPEALKALMPECNTPTEISRELGIYRPSEYRLSG